MHLRTAGFGRRFSRAICASVLIEAAAAAPALAQTVYEYDELGRLKRAVYSESVRMTDFVYDPAGNRQSVSSAAATAASFAISDAAVTEGGTLVFTVSKNGTTVSPHAVSYQSANGTASSGSDYVAVSGVLSFAFSETSKTISVTTPQDALFENNETVYINLSAPTNGAAIADAQGAGVINNDDPAPTFSINNISQPEGGVLTFTVAKSGATGLTHSVNYATADGSATAGSDYAAQSGTLSFAPAESGKTISIASTQDTIFETDETFFLNLSGATVGALISDSQGLGTIVNDDSQLPPNQNPVAITDSVSMAVFDTAVIQPLANDYDPDGGSVSLVSFSDNSTWITETWNSSTKTMSIDALNSGSFVITYVISDGQGGSATGYINVSVSQE